MKGNPPKIFCFMKFWSHQQLRSSQRRIGGNSYSGCRRRRRRDGGGQWLRRRVRAKRG